jgi:hypothetical protein
VKRALAVLVAACTGAPVRPVVQLATTAVLPAGRVDQIVEQGDAVYVFERERIAIVRGGTVATVIQIPIVPATEIRPAQIWTSAASIPALDGDGRWVVATRWDGALVRVTASGELERIDDRFQPRASEKIALVRGASSTIALGLEHALAVSTDAKHVSRYAVTGELAVGKDRLALATTTGIELWDLPHATRVTFAVRGHPGFLASRLGHPRLVVIGDAAVWVENASKLVRIDAPHPAKTFSAVISGDRLWARAADQLYVLDGDHFTRTSITVPALAELLGSPSGDVWLNKRTMTYGGPSGVALERYSIARTLEDPRWQTAVAPVFSRVCSHCHLPGGSADLDLSTAAAWAANRDEIADRVMVSRTMPPAGTTLSDADLQAVAGWLDATRAGNKK